MITIGRRSPVCYKDPTVMNKSLPSVVKHALFAFGILAICSSAMAAPVKPESFASPERAASALADAAHNNDAATILAIFGPSGEKLVNSGDKVADDGMRARFAERYATAHKIVRDTANRAMLVIGIEEWPFPIPLVRKHGVWHFDAAAGAEEILNRRVGRNEMDAMRVCRDYVRAQRDYSADLQGDHKPPEYAQKIVSSPGQHDGLYWPAGPGEKQSPIGPQMAHARAEGYSGDAPDEAHAPYHGYYYRILTRQGAAAPGGARDYLVDGHMTGGFALIAFPATWGDSGVMSFIVNQNGIVYQKISDPRRRRSRQPSPSSIRTSAGRRDNNGARCSPQTQGCPGNAPFVRLAYARERTARNLSAQTHFGHNRFVMAGPPRSARERGRSAGSVPAIHDHI